MMTLAGNGGEDPTSAGAREVIIEADCRVFRSREFI